MLIQKCPRAVLLHEGVPETGDSIYRKSFGSLVWPEVNISISIALCPLLRFGRMSLGRVDGFSQV